MVVNSSRYPIFYLARSPESAIELDLETLLAQPYLTADLPGVGGVAKTNPEDFRVTELPLYAASGEGEHVWFRVQKVGMDGQTLVDKVADRFGVSRSEVGFAGFKDKYAVTQQWMSVWDRALDPAELMGQWSEEITVLEATRHTNKLKMGQLEGNHFVLTLRDVPADQIVFAEAILERIKSHGVPNYFGPQRFGHGFRTFWQGWNAIALGQLAPHLRKNKRMRSLSLNAVQSAVFNHVLTQRIESGTFSTAVVGDVLEKKEGGLARVDTENLAEWQANVAAGLAWPTGPMMAARMLRATDGVAEQEAESMALFGLTEEMFARRRTDLRGERRPLTVRADNVEFEQLGNDAIRVGFSLPSGSYATVLLRELMKNEDFNGPTS